MTLKTLSFTLFLIAASALSTTILAQNSLNCPAANSIKAEQLYGQWAVQFSAPPAGLPERATMQLQRHAEFSESLAGTVRRELGSAPGTGHAALALLAGDLDEGVLILDESSDKVSITGTWNGEMKPGSCGQVYQGVWKDTSPSAPADAPDVPFTLTRLP